MATRSDRWPFPERLSDLISDARIALRWVFTAGVAAGRF
jgi:hypothetical protein